MIRNVQWLLSLRRDYRRSLLSKRVLLSFTTQHVSVLWSFFTKNKAFHHTQGQLNSYFLSLFYFLSIVSYTTVNNGLSALYLLLTNSSFMLRLSESQKMFNLGQIWQHSEAKIWKPAYVINPCSDKPINPLINATEPSRRGGFKPVGDHKS